jgi:3',5'-cyclic AMP phosphodiesterase CpdA
LPFLLAHLTDAHLGPLVRPRLRELAGKRLTGYLNWTRGRSETHDMDILARIVADIHAQAPDHIACTGDLVNIALPGEFSLARRFLEELGPPDKVSFVPGNHDAYVRSALPLVARTFAPWTTDDDTGRSAFPYVRRRENIALIGVSSAVPTAPLLASGRLGEAQRAALAATLDRLAADGAVRVLMIHHPPHRAGASPTRGLTDARELEALLRRHGAELVIHGHNHRFSVARVEDGGAPIVGAASASAAGGTRTHRAAYNLYEISSEGGGTVITGRMRGLLDDRHTIGELGTIPF